MQAEMTAWQDEYQNAEGEYQRMNAELLQEVPLASEVGLRPVTENPPTVSFPPVISTQFTVPAVINSPQSSGQAMEAEIQARWANLPPLKKSYPGAPPPANWVPEGINVSKSAVQDSQATLPQFFNFIGSSSGISQPIVQPPANVDKTTSIFDIPNTVGFPPALLETYSQQMKKVRGTTNPLPTISEKESSMQDAEQYSGNEISSGEVARIRDEVQGVMRQQFAQACAHAEAISNLEKKMAAQETISKSVNATAEEEEVIDLISKSAASLQKSPPSVLPGSPILVASTPSHAGNGGSAPGFS